MIVRLTDAWTEVLQRRSRYLGHRRLPAPVQELLGEMAAAGVLMQSNIKFNGALVLQVFGDGPVKVAVAEVQSDLSLRATATINGEHRCRCPAEPDGQCGRRRALRHHAGPQGPPARRATLPGRGAAAWRPQRKARTPVSDVLQHYMLQSEQLDTALVLAANSEVAAGLLIQRMPLKGEGNLAQGLSHRENEDQIGHNEDYNRIAHLASSLTRDELLTLDVDTILRRLFWEESCCASSPWRASAARALPAPAAANAWPTCCAAWALKRLKAFWLSAARSRWAASSVASNTASTRWMRRSSSCNPLPPNRLRHRAFSKPAPLAPGRWGGCGCAAPRC